MPERPPKPPFDPVFGAWIVLLVMVLGLFANTVFLFLGCAVFHEPTICARTGGNLRDVALELVAALAILIGARR